MDQRQMILDLFTQSTLPEGTTGSYLSTYELISEQFADRPRPITLDEIGGYPRMKQVIRSLFMDLSEPETSRQFGTQPNSNKFILVTGAKGTGKSLFPKALEGMMRAVYEKSEHLRVDISDLITQYGPQADIILNTIIGHVKQNETNRIPTILHLEKLESLIHPSQRSGNVSELEFSYAHQTINPILLTLSKFGRELGAQSRYVIAYGESRVSREHLPEAAAGAFRRSFHLEPTIEDLAETLALQIRTTRRFAQAAQVDPFVSDIEEEIPSIAVQAEGLVNGDMQQAILNITDRRKAEFEGTHRPITAEEFTKEINALKASKGLVALRTGSGFDFQTPNP